MSFALWSPHFLLIFFNFIGLIYSLSFLILTAKNSFKYNLVNVSFAPIYLLLYIFNQILPFKNIFPLTKYWLLPQFYSQLKSQNNSPIQTQTQNSNNNLQEKITILEQKLENKINRNLEVQNSNKLIEKENKNIKQKIDLIQTQTQNLNLNQSILVLESDSKLVWLIPKITTISVLFVFVISQFFLYFETNLIDLNYNYGKLNNEVFGQLSLVCFVVFGLIYFSNEFGIWQRICSFILLAQSVFLGFVAFKSVFDYIANFALTFKRLYGISVVFLVFGFVLIFAVQNFAKFSKSFLLQKSILLVFLTLILVNLAGFDSLIYYNLPKESDKIDWKYLQELSIDSGNLDKILDKYVVLQREYLQSNLNKFTGHEKKTKL